MITLQIGDNDFYGKRFNGHDLQCYLNARGIESNHIVWDKYSSDDRTYSIKDRISHHSDLYTLLSKKNAEYSTHAMFYPFNYALLFHELFLKTDVVHYHLIHNMNFNLSLLPILTSLKPSVLTLHDPWALTGHCIHPFSCTRWTIGCGDCPDLKTEFAIRDDATALNWQMKKIYYEASDIDIVVASKWMLDLVKASPLMRRFDMHLIPFGLNLDVFKPQDMREAKTKLGIPPDNVVIAFRSMKWELKGLEYIKYCLRRLDVQLPITLLTFNTRGLLDEFSEKFHVVELGWVHDETDMISAYNAADFFIMPSLAEAFGMMAMEAMACGKPTIVFDGTALADTIFAPEGGIAVPNKDEQSLFAEIRELTTNASKRIAIGEKALVLAREHYNVSHQVDRIIAVYKEVIEKRGSDDRNIYILNQLRKIAHSDNRCSNIYADTLIPIQEYQRLQQEYQDLQQSKAVVLARKLKEHPMLVKLAAMAYNSVAAAYRLFRGK